MPRGTHLSNSRIYPASEPIVAVIINTTSGSKDLDATLLKVGSMRPDFWAQIHATLYREHDLNPDAKQALDRAESAGFIPFAVPDEERDPILWFESLIGAEAVVLL